MLLWTESFNYLFPLTQTEDEGETVCKNNSIQSSLSTDFGRQYESSAKGTKWGKSRHVPYIYSILVNQLLRIRKLLPVMSCSNIITTHKTPPTSYKTSNFIRLRRMKQLLWQQETDAGKKRDTRNLQRRVRNKNKKLFFFCFVLFSAAPSFQTYLCTRGWVALSRTIGNLTNAAGLAKQK